MNTRTPLRLLVAASVAVPLVLSACSDGGGTRTTDADQSLTVPEGLARSPATTTKATNASESLATLLPNPANLFAPLAALVGGDYSEHSPGSELASDLRVKTVSSDGNNGFRVTFVIGGEEQTIHFEATDFGRYNYFKEVDGVEYYLASHTDSFERANKNQGSLRYRYFDLGQFAVFDAEADVIDRNYMSYGTQTVASNLPGGEATYSGSMSAYTYLNDDHTSAQRVRVRGGVRLTADFDSGALNGVILGIRTRGSAENNWSPLSDTTRFEISEGQIVDGQFAATLTGRDSNAEAPMDNSVRGYAGGILGEFYGPAAEEVGGVLNASRSDRVMVGVFGGSQLGPDDPNGLVASTAAPAIYATNADDTLEGYVGDGTRFAPLNSTLLKDWGTGREVLAAKESHIRTFGMDANNVIHLSYVVGGEERTVQFTPADLDDGQYEKDVGGVTNYLWSTTRDIDGPWNYRYMDVNFFRGGYPSLETYHYFSYGVRTDASSLPAGSATYVGRMRGESYNQFAPSNAESRTRMRDGDLNLTADFDESTLEGTISGIQVRRPGEDSWSPLPDTTGFAIGNGQIVAGRFSATLTGMDMNSSAPLHDSFRGYQGEVLGEFYGPAAEEVGGVLSATREEDMRVMHGGFYGKNQP